jgi:hypothetical protein
MTSYLSFREFLDLQEGMGDEYALMRWLHTATKGKVKKLEDLAKISFKFIKETGKVLIRSIQLGVAKVIDYDELHQKLNSTVEAFVSFLRANGAKEESGKASSNRCTLCKGYQCDCK